MSLLDRLRPRWRHPDPEVRAAAVRELGRDDQKRLAAVAEADADPRVRRVALKKVEDPDLLLAVAGRDPDESLRALAAERAREVLVGIATASGEPEAAAATAAARLDDPRSLARVAMGAPHAGVRAAALARVSDERLLRDVVKGAGDPAIRREALGRIRDASALRGIALSDVPAELALEALARIEDPEVLRAIAENRAAAKSVRQRAQALAGGAHPLRARECRARQLQLCIAVEGLAGETAGARLGEIRREWEALALEAAPRDDVRRRFARAGEAVEAEVTSRERRRVEADRARSAVEESLAAREALCRSVEALDGADAVTQLAAARAAWDRLASVPEERGAALARRFADAGRACEARHERWLARDTLRAKLEALVHEAEALETSAPASGLEGRWTALERRWAALGPAGETSDAIALLRHRFAEAGERLRQRREEDRERRHRGERENLARLADLAARLEAMAAAEALELGAARRALAATRAALQDPEPLPPGESRAAWTARLSRAQDQLLPRFRQEEEAEDWRRWANVGAQEELIRRAEALVASDDLAEVTRQLGPLLEDWQRVAVVPRERAEALWERFRTARDTIRRRADAWLADNQRRKQALCDEVAPLADSTDWNATAETIKRLQAEWKQIGPAPGRHDHALWRRFREPCDRFFARRKEHLDRLTGERSENARRKTALCAEAEALADSTDWEATATALKRLQAEWKRIGPAPRAEADVLWARFRTACDRFFDRQGRRGELELEERLRRAEAVCAGLEALLAAGAPPPEDLPQRIDEAWGEWRRLDLFLVETARPLAERFRDALERLAAAHPEGFSGTGLDPAATRGRRERICSRLEELVRASTAEESAPSLAEQALRLREALAANTIGGSAAPRLESRREAERLRASWVRLGPGLGAEDRALDDRFRSAYTRLSGSADRPS